jgi:hypothetical protein
MIWSLNRFASKRYVKEKPFQEYLISRMIDPSKQLSIRFDAEGFNIQSSSTIETLSFHHLRVLLVEIFPAPFLIFRS